MSRSITRGQILAFVAIKALLYCTVTNTVEGNASKQKLLRRAAKMAGFKLTGCTGIDNFKLCKELLEMYENDHLRLEGR